MDPLSISAAVAGFLTLAWEVTKILNEYISGVKSAPDDATTLLTEFSILCDVLNQLAEFLRSEDAKGHSFDNTSVLRAAIAGCQDQIMTLYKKFDKLCGSDKSKIVKLYEQFKWPFQKEEFQKTIELMHRFVVTFQFSLAIKNCTLLSKTSSEFLAKMEEDKKELQEAINTMRKFTKQLAIPDEMLQKVAEISEILALVSELAKSQVVLDQIHSGVQGLKETLKGDEMEKMLQWISPLNPQQRHQDIKSERLEGTGGWFLENPDFQKWCNSQNEESSMSIFACYGIPGAGKSIICSRVIDHLLETSLDQQGQETCIAYFYCDYRDGEQYTPKNIIGGMLKQVLTTRSPSKPFTEINNIIHSLCKRQKNMRTELTLDETCQFLAQAMSYFAKVYLCIDALDECRDGHRRVLLKSLNGLRRELKQTGSICMYLTGRSNIKDEIQMSLCSDSALFSTELEANPEDIRKYILHQINMDTHKDSPMNNELQKEILDKIVDSSATMFLLPALQIQEVLRHVTIRARRKALETLPKGLDDAFKVTINRIKNQDEVRSALAMKVISWTFLAKSPLTVEMLCHALAVDVEDDDRDMFDWDNIPSERSVIEVCSGLITIDKETSCIRLVHKSLQDYLERQQAERPIFPNIHSEIARTCLKYMGFRNTTVRNIEVICDYFEDGSGFEISRWELNEILEERLHDFPFLLYAIRQWGFHAKEQPDKTVNDLAIDLLLDESKSSAISRRLHSVVYGLYYIIPSGEICSPLHVFAYFGLENIAGDYIQRFGNDDIDSKVAPTDITPLHISARSHDADFVRLLLRNNADVHSKDKDGMSPLLEAAKAGSIQAVRLLLNNGADATSKTINGQTALLLAAGSPSSDINAPEELLTLLLEETGTNIESKDDSGYTPLLMAARMGNARAVSFLLEKGADINAKDTNQRTALSLASSAYSGTETVRLLMEQKCVEIDSKDSTGRTPLLWAACDGEEKSILLLLENGADIQATDDHGNTVLSLSATSYRQEALRVLLDQKQVPIETRNDEGQTALLSAAAHGKSDCILTLLEEGADITAKDILGRTALSLAVKSYREEAVNLILEQFEQKGIDLDLSDMKGRTPLSWAAEIGDDKTTFILLKKGVNVNSRDENGLTPLLWAARSGEHTSILAFLEAGADITAQDNNGRTAISFAAESYGGARSLMIMSKQKDANMELKDHDGRTPFLWAAVGNNEKTMRFLLDNGTDIYIKDKAGRTAASLAAEAGGLDSIRFLIKQGFDVGSRDGNGDTPLLFAQIGTYNTSAYLMCPQTLQRILEEYKLETACLFLKDIEQMFEDTLLRFQETVQILEDQWALS